MRTIEPQHLPRSPASTNRLQSLDVLRFAAIALVLAQHLSPHGGIVARFGWTGVDLFFVLSGYLVTGLLLKEDRSRGSVDSVRFLARRGFKIYPAFWLMIGATLVYFTLTKQTIRPLALACELLFFQNYGPALWVHTWSLAVEEHFYLLLAIAFLSTNGIRRRRVPRARTLLAAIATATALVMIGRLATLHFVNEAYKLRAWGTHIRIDALLMGATIAALSHYHPTALSAAWKRVRVPFAAATFVAAATSIVVGGSLLALAGFTFIALFFSSVLIQVLENPLPTNKLTQVLANVGRHSYGIYLWHLLVLDLLSGLRSSVAGTLAVGVIAIVVGMALSAAIEGPFLRLRERIAPARAPLQPVNSGGSGSALSVAPAE